jgi:DNA-binding response OmpR family regulator
MANVRKKMRWMRQIKIRLREAPRVLVRRTGRSADHELRVSEERFALALEAGADEVLKKPLLTRELDISLDRVLRSRCGTRDAE